MEGHFHFVLVSWKKRGYDRENAFWRAVWESHKSLGRIQLFYFFALIYLRNIFVLHRIM